jgi:hypothetical protein
MNVSAGLMFAIGIPEPVQMKFALDNWKFEDKPERVYDVVLQMIQAGMQQQQQVESLKTGCKLLRKDVVGRIEAINS